MFPLSLLEKKQGLIYQNSKPISETLVIWWSTIDHKTGCELSGTEKLLGEHLPIAPTLAQYRR